jgi:hypothetical protein
MLTHEQQANFTQNGFLLVPQILSQAEVQALRQTVKQMYAQASPYPGEENQFRADVFCRQPDLRWLMTHPPLVAVLRSLLGEDFVYIHEVSIHFRNYAFGWHKDTTSQEKVGSYFQWSPHFLMAECVLYLQDNSVEYAGGLDVFPGSHNLPDRYVSGHPNIESPYPEQTPYQIPTKAGDFTLFNLRLDHTATQPKSNVPEGSPNEKIGIFFIASANNQHVHHYSLYQKSREDYHFLKDKHDYPDDMKEEFDRCYLHLAYQTSKTHIRLPYRLEPLKLCWNSTGIFEPSIELNEFGIKNFSAEMSDVFVFSKHDESIPENAMAIYRLLDYQEVYILPERYDQIWVPNESIRSVLQAQSVPSEKIIVFPFFIDYSYFKNTSRINSIEECDNSFCFFALLDSKQERSSKYLLKAFLETFDKTEKVSLILKSVNEDLDTITHQVIEWLAEFNFLPSEIPTVYLIKDDLNLENLLLIYQNTDVFIDMNTGISPLFNLGALASGCQVFEIVDPIKAECSDNLAFKDNLRQLFEHGQQPDRQAKYTIEHDFQSLRVRLAGYLLENFDRWRYQHYRTSQQQLF